MLLADSQTKYVSCWRCSGLNCLKADGCFSEIQLQVSCSTSARCFIEWSQECVFHGMHIKWGYLQLFRSAKHPEMTLEEQSSIGLAVLSNHKWMVLQAAQVLLWRKIVIHHHFELNIRIIEYQVGRDLKDQPVRTLSAKTLSRQDDPASCLAES